jgi:hypothetical protein
MQLVSVTTLPTKKIQYNKPLNNNSFENITLDLQLPINTRIHTTILA